MVTEDWERYKNSRLPLQKFRVTSTIEAGQNLSEANCLNPFFILGEPKFIDAVKTALGAEAATMLEALAKRLNIYDIANHPKHREFAEKYGSSYTATELLECVLSTCSIVLLNGPIPAQHLAQTFLPKLLHNYGVPSFDGCTVNEMPRERLDEIIANMQRQQTASETLTAIMNAQGLFMAKKTSLPPSSPPVTVTPSVGSVSTQSGPISPIQTPDLTPHLPQSTNTSPTPTPFF